MTAKVFVDKDAVLAAARNRWALILSEWYGAGAGSLDGQHRPCPGCGGRDRFRFDDKNGEGSWLCSQGGGGVISGGGLELIMHITGAGWHEALVGLAERLGIEPERRGTGGARDASPGAMAPGPGPQMERPGKATQFDVKVMERVVRRELRETKAADVMRLSPILPGSVTPGDYLETVYEQGERVLVFCEYRSQGDFLYIARERKWYRLADRPGVKAVRVESGPLGSPEGVWYLTQPVTGIWEPNPRAGGKLSRRSAEGVVRWTYLVLESDEAPEALWLGLLLQLQLPIQAIYRSGGRSIHALVKLPTRRRDEWEEVRRIVLPVLSRVGADPGAISGVRLSRLPGCWRGRRLQELLYLHPEPDEGGRPIIDGGWMWPGRERAAEEAGAGAGLTEE